LLFPRFQFTVTLGLGEAEHHSREHLAEEIDSK
jgi:hypothetical protein